MEIKESPMRSWFDVKSSRMLSADLTQRLCERMAGKRGLFVTLTYDPDGFDGPLDVYRRAREERHVRRFIEKLGRYLGVSLTGKWCRKMEFQGNGTPHWHLVIECPRYLDKETIAGMWGHGFVNIKRTTQKRLRYFAKYFSKPGDIPGWLLGEACRSVRIVAASPGFWQNEAQPKPKSRATSRCLPCYQTLGDRLSRSGRVVVRDCVRARPRTLDLTFRQLLSLLAACGGSLRAVGRGWFECDTIAQWTKTGAPAPAGAPFDLIPMREPPDLRWIDDFLIATGQVEEHVIDRFGERRTAA